MFSVTWGGGGGRVWLMKKVGAGEGAKGIFSGQASI